MKVAVFGAGGKVGSLVVGELLTRGHQVNAFVHSRPPRAEADGLKIVKGDVYDAPSVTDAIAGCDAVISALSSWHSPRKDVLSAGMTAIIPAMRSAGVSRIISLTGADARVAGDRLGMFHRLSYPLLSLAAGKVLQDGEAHIRQLQESGLQWTVLRSPVMTPGAVEAYALRDDRPLPWTTVPRQAVAKAMCDLLESGGYDGQSPYIVRG